MKELISNLKFDYSRFVQYTDIKFDRKNINKLSPLNIEIVSDVRLDELPPFLYRMIETGAMYPNEKQKLMERFGIYYLHYSEFRKIVDGWVILILACKYNGIYPDEHTCITEAHKLKIPGCDIHLSPMYLEIRDEYLETKSTLYNHG